MFPKLISLFDRKEKGGKMKIIRVVSIAIIIIASMMADKIYSISDQDLFNACINKQAMDRCTIVKDDQYKVCLYATDGFLKCHHNPIGTDTDTCSGIWTVNGTCLIK